MTKEKMEEAIRVDRELREFTALGEQLANGRAFIKNNNLEAFTISPETKKRAVDWLKERLTTETNALQDKFDKL